METGSATRLRFGTHGCKSAAFRRGLTFGTRLFVAAILTFSVSGISAAGQSNYKHVSVCEVLAMPNEGNLRYVAIDGDLIIARPHGVVLVDERCPEKGLGLDFSSRGANQSVANLEKSIRKGYQPLESTGRFCGEIRRVPKTNRLVLSLRSVLDLRPKNSS